MNTYAVIGKWHKENNVKKGLTVFRFDEENGTLDFLADYDPEVCSGNLCYNKEKQVLYAVDEVSGRPGELGGGGRVLSYHVDLATGELTFMSSVPTYMSKPCYLALHPDGKFVLAACHGGRTAVNKVAFDGKGNPVGCVVTEDTGIVLFPTAEDGSLKSACDVALHRGVSHAPGQVLGHPHSVKGSPDGKIFFACDKGLDRIFSYSVDEENGKLIPMASRQMPFATAPRYSAFHPTLPVWYENNETDGRVYAFRYEDSGVLTELSCATAYSEEDEKKFEGARGDEAYQSSDIAVAPNGRFLYVAARGTDLERIVKWNLDEKTGEILGERKLFPLSIGTPRGICLSPDGRFLFVACAETAKLAVFALDENGDLHCLADMKDVTAAANILIIQG